MSHEKTTKKSRPIKKKGIRCACKSCLHIYPNKLDLLISNVAMSLFPSLIVPSFAFCLLRDKIQF